MDDLRDKHRAEQKELQSRIQLMKKSVNPSDKKRKKEVATEITALKEELDIRHAQQLLTLSSVDQVAHQISETHVSESGGGGFKYEVKEVSKAQKKKEKKKQAERERRDRIQDEDISSLTESKRKEADKLAALLSARRLAVHDVPSDGDCLYNSVKHQLSIRGMEVSVEMLRRKASDYMRCHKELFQQFMSTDDGDIISDAEFEAYCDSVAKTNEWGGNLELRALSEALEYPVEVIQADGPVLEFGSQFGEKNVLLISYHRYAYSLGEHYNSLVSK